MIPTRYSIIAVFSVLLATPYAAAGTKEEIMRLQSDVLAMQNQIRLLEKTVKDQSEGLQNLVAQLNDQMAKANQILTRVASTLDNQAAGDKSSNTALLQEIRNLSAKVDDSSTRISALAQQVADLKVQARPLTQAMAAGGDAGGGALSPDAVYNQAFNDLVQGNFDLAVGGFTAFLKDFPSNEKADSAQYNIGEAYYNSGKYPQAVGAFSRVINDYPSGVKIASAYFKRAKAELMMREKENAVTDFKTVIEKYPDSAEANLAKQELQNLGVSLPKPGAKPPAKRRP